MHRFKHALVRALAWTIASPNMMDETCGLPVKTAALVQSEFTHSLDWLLTLDRDPTPLINHVETQGNWRVGIQLECLINFWLEHHPNYALIARNLQVYEGKQTLGAFDYIVRHNHGRIEHWEVAVKFYLRSTTATTWPSWVGPNRRDRLDIKLARMRDHQLPLSHSAAGRAALAKVGVDTAPIHVAWIKGLLFNPYTAPVLSPPHAGTNTPSGIWVEIRQQRHFTARYPGHKWYLREKPDWLGNAREPSARCLDHETWINRTALGINSRPEMWSLMALAEQDIYQEAARIFLVPDGWSPDLNP
jgi:hypothetical protein